MTKNIEYCPDCESPLDECTCPDIVEDDSDIPGREDVEDML